MPPNPRIAIFLLLAAAPVYAGQSPIQPPALSEAAAKSEQGLTLTFSAGGKKDVRDARLISLHVPAGQPVSPFLPAGAFTATWDGEIASALRAQYTFSAEAQGDFKLTVNGAVVLEKKADAGGEAVEGTVRLNKGPNKLVAELAADGKTDAFVRLNWRAKDFPLEPVSATVFAHDSSAKELREARRIRQGRLLFAQMRCTACHGDPALPPRGQGMPELAQDAPMFDDIGSKFNEPWLAHWIADPHSIRPHSLMPKVFAQAKAGELDQRAADLAAYFVSTGKPAASAPAAEAAPAGGALFANLGCIACHTAPAFTGNDPHGRTPLSHLKAKWNPAALSAYLKEPARNFAWTHMPNFALSDGELRELTAYLLSGTQREFAAGPKGDATRGAQLLVSSGCLNCHAGLPPTTQPTLETTLKSSWLKGCMAADAPSRGNAPDFALSGEQREALLAFASIGFSSLKQDSAIEFADRQLQNMQCAACHVRDGQGNRWAELTDEMSELQAAAPAHAEGEGVPITGALAPMLTWAGEKLQPKWMETFIAGHGKTKPRPWLVARMPGFAAVSAGVAEGLSLEHGFSPVLAPAAAVDSAQAENGEKLLGENGGFNCTTCHGIGAKAATAVFEAPGINLGYAPERLRNGYFHRWLMHPLRIDPESKMPRFADDEGKTPLTDFYDGDARLQFGAIWEYLRSAAK